MINLFVAIGLAVLACAAVIAVMLYAGSRKGRADEADRAERRRSVSREEEESHETITVPDSALPSILEELGVDIPTVSCRGMTRENPDAPLSNTDAVVVDLIRQAPELPSAVLELSDMLRDPEAQVKAVTDLVSTDPVLSAKILRVANSAAYGLRKITSLQQAIVLLGFNNIWILVHQLMTSSAIQPFAKLSREEMAQLWRHAAATAVCAKRVLFSAGYASNEIGATVITCALMHDVGKFLLRGLQPIKKEREEIYGDDEVIPPTVVDEETRYGIDHCRMGYLLSTYWKLPEQVCTAIGYHHHASFDNWEDVPSHVKDIVAMVALSDSVAAYAGFHDGRPVSLKVLPEAVRGANLDLNPEPASYITNELIKDLHRMEALLNAA